MSIKRTSKKHKRNRFGYVYILSNPSIKGIKIGLTERHINERMKELNRSTSIPTPFNVEYYIDTKDCYALERAMHQHYSSRRINNKREFFKLPVWRAKYRLKRERMKIDGVESIFSKSNTFLFSLTALSLSFIYILYINDFSLESSWIYMKDLFGIIKYHTISLLNSTRDIIPF